MTAVQAMDVPVGPSVALHFARLVTDYAALRGIAADGLLAGAGLGARSLDDPDARLPFADFSRLCDHLGQCLNDPAIGLHLGQSVKPGHLGSHGYALVSCDNGRELLRRSARYSALVFDACRNEFEERDGECIRFWRSNLPGGAPIGRVQDELNMALWVAFSRWIAGRADLAPNWVSFRHARPADIGAHEALFRCPLRFGAAETALGFPAADLDLPLSQGNPQVRQMMDSLSERLLAQRAAQAEPAWLGDARRAVMRAFEQGTPELAEIAAAVGLEPGGLRDRLAARGIGFRDLVDDLRRGLALGYARDAALGLVDIAYLLGFSEQSAFQRAFKRWTGTTPGEYRRRAI